LNYRIVSKTTERQHLAGSVTKMTAVKISQDQTTIPWEAK